jgi:hypothetical protein
MSYALIIIFLRFSLESSYILLPQSRHETAIKNFFTHAHRSIVQEMINQTH